MDFIVNIINLFGYLFSSSLVFEQIIYLFIGVCVFLMVIYILESYFKGYYKK